MSKLTLSLPVIFALAGAPAIAQETGQGPPTHVYEAYFKINFADLNEFNGIYRDFSVPVLQKLQEAGVIQGWSAWQHETGGEYNWRFSIRTWDWASFDKFWGEYFEQLPDDAVDRFQTMVAAHHDEIWDITGVHFREGQPPDTRYLYQSGFQVSFGDVDHWTTAWDAHVAPVLEQAMADGILGGWVTQGHNTGGRHNVRVLYFFEDWDNIDDCFDRVISSLQSDPQVWETVGRMIMSHEDNIWAPVPGEGEM